MNTYQIKVEPLVIDAEDIDEAKDKACEILHTGYERFTVEQIE